MNQWGEESGRRIFLGKCVVLFNGIMMFVYGIFKTRQVFFWGLFMLFGNTKQAILDDVESPVILSSVR